MYGVGTDVDVLELEPGRRILIQWDPENPTFVEWRFEPEGDDQTLVKIRNWGFRGSRDEIVAAAIDATGGFSFVVAGAKSYLEHGIELNLVPDHHPAALVKDWPTKRTR